MQAVEDAQKAREERHRAEKARQQQAAAEAERQTQEKRAEQKVKRDARMAAYEAQQKAPRLARLSTLPQLSVDDHQRRAVQKAA